MRCYRTLIAEGDVDLKVEALNVGAQFVTTDRQRIQRAAATARDETSVSVPTGERQPERHGDVGQALDANLKPSKPRGDNRERRYGLKIGRRDISVIA